MIGVRELTVLLNSRPVVDGVSFSLAPGEFAALTGPNGAGKSSVLRALAGAVPAAAGDVTLGGAPAATMGLRERAKRVAWLPQARPVAWNLRVEDVVALGRFALSPLAYDRLDAAGRGAVEAALRKAGALHLAGRGIDALSGGEQARVHLARILASPAPCLLLDEPCAALDIAQQLSLMQVLAAEAAEGRAVLVVLHDLDLAARFCSRVLVMAEGRMAADGAPAEALREVTLRDVFRVRRDASGALVSAG